MIEMPYLLPSHHVRTLKCSQAELLKLGLAIELLRIYSREHLRRAQAFSYSLHCMTAGASLASPSAWPGFFGAHDTLDAQTALWHAPSSKHVICFNLDVSHHSAVPTRHTVWKCSTDSVATLKPNTY